MDILLQLQQDLTDALNGDPSLTYIPFASFRKLVIAEEIEKRLPHLTLKNGKMGCGGIVNMPTIFGEYSNVTVPQTVALCTIDLIENPELNFNPTNGSTITCEEAARAVRAIVEPLGIVGLGVFFANENEPVIAPITDIGTLYPNCAGYRVGLRIKFSENFLPKVVMPTASWSTDTLTLTNNTAGATLYYTTDGTFPGPGNHGTKQDDSAGTAMQYAVPVMVASGTTVRFAANKVNYTGSDVGQTIAP